MLYLKLLRVHHWIKNLFLFIPLFFAGQAFKLEFYPKLLLGVLSFCLVASSVYILNDIRDQKADKNHPTKKLRPIAAGLVPVSAAFLYFFILVSTGLVIAFYLDITFFSLTLVYLVLNVGYSFGLKNFSVIDIFIVASGFLIRIYAGGSLTTTPVSHWLAIMVLLLALFLALAKRRDDLLLDTEKGEVRKSIRSYNLEFINSCLSMFAGIIIVAYILYTVSPEVIAHFGTDWLFLTSLFVIAGVMRYLQIVYVNHDSGSPTAILYKDIFIITTLLGWIISFYVIIYIA